MENFEEFKLNNRIIFKLIGFEIINRLYGIPILYIFSNGNVVLTFINNNIENIYFFIDDNVIVKGKHFDMIKRVFINNLFNFHSLAIFSDNLKFTIENLKIEE